MATSNQQPATSNQQPATRNRQPETLYQIWQHHHAGDFAAGVRLLVQHNPTGVTPTILARLQKIAYTGEPASPYECGKLGDALQKIVVGDNPTPDPSPIGRGGVENTVERPAKPAATEHPTPAATVQLTPAATEHPTEHPTPAATEQPTEHATEHPTPAATEHPTEHPTSPLPMGEGSGVGLTSPRAKELHKEHAHVHALMVSATTDADRARYAKDIMERIIPALDAEYDRLRAAQSGGDSQSPPDSERPDSERPDSEATGPILNTADAHAFKKLQSVRSRISRLKKELIPGATDPKRREKLEKELAEKQKEKERLEKELA